MVGQAAEAVEAKLPPVLPPAVKDTEMLRPSAAFKRTTPPVSIAVTPVVADCALIACTCWPRWWQQSWRRRRDLVPFR